MELVEKIDVHHCGSHGLNYDNQEEMQKLGYDTMLCPKYKNDSLEIGGFFSAKNFQ